MDDDVVDRCPRCEAELEARPASADHHLVMALQCPEHGEVAVLEPF
jgi:uncharacterized radical SAM superfamily Fe-S cluster-containing enzyme